ncbi:MAG: aldehyde dehydrogenase family protein [Acetivibrionales bacterium]|jgi:succinate-semialdehyde dehydrogenase/glutarate-semialdehyde dehydrogenase
MFKQYINGKLVQGAGKEIGVENPATGEVFKTFNAATAEQAVEALQAAQTAFRTWSYAPLDERVNWLRKYTDAILNEREYIVDLLSAETGKPYAEACYDFDWGISSLRYFAEEIRRVTGTTYSDNSGKRGQFYHLVDKRPLGVVVGHLAWNYPLGNAALKIGPTIASGCCCVIKPSSQTPLATLYLGEVMHRIGLPAGVVNIIAGPSDELGEALNTSRIPKMITLIGSTQTGRQVMAQGATSIKTYSLELGGNAPCIIMEDADVEEAARLIVISQVSNTGQTCIGYNRIYVHESRYEEFCNCVLERLKKVTIGAGRDPGEMVMGPMINKRERDRVLGLINDAKAQGARVLYGGDIPAGFEKGAYISPTLVVDVTEDMCISKEEIFGPVISARSYSDFEDALQKANNTEMGLTSYLFGHDARAIARAYEVLEFGELYVNGFSTGPMLPHVGMRESGIGCDASKWGLAEYFTLKRLSLKP